MSFDDVALQVRLAFHQKLGGIADKYNVSLADLKKWNKIKGSKIVPGQSLKIHSKVKMTVIVENDESENTANNKATKEVTPQQEEERTEATANSEASTNVTPKKEAAPQYKYYTVQPGDTLYKIAAKYDGVSIEQIKKLNSGLKENKLAVGQKIKIKQIG